MKPTLHAITVRPKTDTLRHYLTLEAECKNASPSADTCAQQPATGGVSAAGGAAELNRTLREIALAPAMRCAEFEARHTGPFNWSGKELYRK